MKTIARLLFFLLLGISGCSLGKKAIMKNDFAQVFLGKCSIEHGKLILTGLSIERMGKARFSPWAEVSIYVSPKEPVEPGKSECKLVFCKKITIRDPGKIGSISFPNISTPIKLEKGWTHGALLLKWEVNETPTKLKVSIPVTVDSSSKGQ